MPVVPFMLMDMVIPYLPTVTICLLEDVSCDDTAKGNEPMLLFFHLPVK
jgi:hypothetical protein